LYAELAHGATYLGQTLLIHFFACFGGKKVMGATINIQRARHRGDFAPDNRYDDFGFRLALSPE
ncbi:MAG: hypothetical protein LBP61_06865, partial [Desulfovibrio sp.]|nr:hypothetical protein [Desulfovibrio sp.]